MRFVACFTQDLPLQYHIAPPLWLEENQTLVSGSTTMTGTTLRRLATTPRSRGRMNMLEEECSSWRTTLIMAAPETWRVRFAVFRPALRIDTQDDFTFEKSDQGIVI